MLTSSRSFLVMALAAAAAAVASLATTSNAYSVSPKKIASIDTSSSAAVVDRRTAFCNALGAAATVGAGVLLSSPTPALASGGATAGKYTYVVVDYIQVIV